MAKAISKKKFRRIINSYLLAQDDPTENIDTLQEYLREKGIGEVSKDLIKKEIKRQLEHRKKEKILQMMETDLFKREKEQKKYRYGSAFCPECDMFKDHQKECPYCGKLEMTR